MFGGTGKKFEVSGCPFYGFRKSQAKNCTRSIYLTLLLSNIYLEMFYSELDETLTYSEL